MTRPNAEETAGRNLRIVSLVVLLGGGVAASAGLFWPSDGTDGAIGLYGKGLYRRDTSFVAGGSQGSDFISLLVILPLGLLSLAGSLDGLRRLGLVIANTWWLYLSMSLAFGAVAFNELFPLYLSLMPLSAFALLLALHRLRLSHVPRGLSVFLIGCGIVTGVSWSLLLWLEMRAGAFPPDTYYTVRTTYAIDLGIITPGCIAAGVALWRGWPWGGVVALPLLSFAALLLPMMLAQTLMQIRAGVVFGPEAAAPFVGFTLLSFGAAWFLLKMSGSLRYVPR